VEAVTAGRHDPCVLPRAVPVVEAMTALTLCDLCLISLKDDIFKN
jgi:chorismate synthase